MMIIKAVDMDEIASGENIVRTGEILRQFKVRKDNFCRHRRKMLFSYRCRDIADAYWCG